MIESVSQNHLSGIDRVTNSYSFVGELLTSKRQHVPSVGATTTILTTNSYDHVGRLLETKKKVNEQPEVIQSRLSYNGIGQLKSKARHSENGGTDFLNTINYTYNERGWTTGISSPQFTQQLKYHEPATGKQYNGNIAQQLWGHGATTSSTFTYTYDRLNRLINGTSAGTTVMGEELTYDEMGNIRTLKRETGLITSYSYDNGNRSNRLMALSGGITGSYQYDQNGNATMDRMSTVFTYNYLNLPQTATRTGTSVSYVYDAMGTKLTKNSTVNGVIGRQDYVGGIEYSAPNVIERIATEEGYLLNSNGTYSYHYYLTDHLGNNRVVLKKGTSLTVPEIIQRQDYYPFGKTRSLVIGGNNRYLYNGKEVQKELGDQLDYGARFYDAEIGRWNVVDPMAEKYMPLSPYVYAANNPLYYVDPNGKDIYRYDDKTGEFVLSVKNDDEFDQVGRFKYDKKSGEYTLRTNRKGEAKTRIDNIEKGILSDGINFRDNSNFIEVGKEGQPTVEGVQNFVVELGEMVGKEIAGYHMAENGKSEVSYSFIGKYVNNTETKSYAGMTFAMRPDLLGKIEPVTDFHTHPSGPRFSISDRLRPSTADLNKRNSTQKYFPNVKKFIILTKDFDPVDYTNYR